MRKLFWVSILIVSFSCSKSENTSHNEAISAEPEIAEPAVVTDPITEGKSLIEGSDCLGCHKLDEKMIGPSYKEVAAKYENTPENVEMLADKILKGSSGVWGNVPMPAHGFSKKNAKFMAQYILSSK